MSSDVLRSPCRGRVRGRVRVVVRGGRGALLLLLQVVACLCFVALAKSSKSKSTDKHFSPVPLRFKLDDGSVHTFSGGSGSSSSSSSGAVPSGQTKTVKLRDGTKLTYTAGGGGGASASAASAPVPPAINIWGVKPRSDLPPPMPPAPPTPERIEERIPPPPPYEVPVYECQVQRQLTEFPKRKRGLLFIMYYEPAHDVGKGSLDGCEVNGNEVNCAGAKHQARARDAELRIRRELCNIEAFAQSVHHLNPHATAVLLTTEHAFLGDVETHKSVDLEVVRVDAQQLGTSEKAVEKNGGELPQDGARPIRALIAFLEAEVKSSHEQQGINVIFVAGPQFLVVGKVVEPFISLGGWTVGLTYSPAGNTMFHPEVLYLKQVKLGSSSGHERNLNGVLFLKDVVRRLDEGPKKRKKHFSKLIDIIAEGMHKGAKGMQASLMEASIAGMHSTFSRDYMFVDQNPQGEDWGVLRGMNIPVTRMPVMFFPTQIYNCRAGYSSAETLLVRFSDVDFEKLVSAWDLLLTGQATVVANQTEPGRRPGLDMHEGRQIFLNKKEAAYGVGGVKREHLQTFEDKEMKMTYKRGHGNKRSTGESILTISADSMRMSLHDHRQSAARNPESQVNRDSFPSGFSLNDPSTTERNARTPEEEARLQHVTYHYGKKEANKILEEKAKIRQIVEDHHRKHDPGRFVHGDADVHF